VLILLQVKVPTLKKNQVQMNISLLPSAFYQQWKNERLLGSDLNKFGKDTNKSFI
jgi:hypothetical protein